MRGVVGLRTNKSLDKHLEAAFAEVGSLAMPHSKFDLGKTVEGKGINDKLKNILNKVCDQAITMQEKHFKDLFSEKGRAALWSLSSNGTFVNINPQVQGNMYLYLDIIKQMVIAAFVPKAWEEYPKFRNKGESPNIVIFSKPFFINTGQACDDGSKPKRISEWGDHNFQAICYNDKKWHAMVVKVTSRFDFYEREMVTKAELIQPPKVPELYIVKGFEYVELSALLSSAYQGWEKGNHVQYWTPPGDATVVKKNDNYKLQELQYADGPGSAGLVQVQVCPNWEETMESIRQTIFKGKKPDITRLKKNAWPCGA